jgi:hypothetical protein
MTVRVRGASMQVGIVFSQADSGVDPVAIRQFAIIEAKAEVDRIVG